MARRLLREEREAVPDLSGGEEVATIVRVLGNGMVEVRPFGKEEAAEDEKEAKACVALLPAKFRGVLFVRSGSFVVVRLQEPLDSGLVRSEVTRVLLPEHIKHLRKTGQWPAGADAGDVAGSATAGAGAEARGVVSQDDLLFENGNQRRFGQGAEDSSSSDDDSD